MEDMAARGVKYVDCYGVDNALVSMCILREIILFYFPFLFLTSAMGIGSCCRSDILRVLH
jgi:hypothetical protein